MDVGPMWLGGLWDAKLAMRILKLYAKNVGDFDSGKAREMYRFLEIVKDEKTGEYFSYLLLDFVTSDPALEDIPLVAAFKVAEEIGISKILRKLSIKETKITAKTLDVMLQNSEEMLKSAGKELVTV